MTTRSCEITIRLWSVFEGVGCGAWGSTTLAVIVLAGIGAFVWQAWLRKS
jgi:hypothetical protein